METKEIKITAPEGYEIDSENSTFERIVFKKVEKKVETYDEVAEKLFKDKNTYFTESNGSINDNMCIRTSCFSDPNNATTQEQLEWLMALNKLQNVANYLNEGWVPNWADENTRKYYLWYNHWFNKIQSMHWSTNS